MASVSIATAVMWSSIAPSCWASPFFGLPSARTCQSTTISDAGVKNQSQSPGKWSRFSNLTTGIDIAVANEGDEARSAVYSAPSGGELPASPAPG